MVSPDKEGKELMPLREGVIFGIYHEGNIVLQKRLNPRKTYFGFTIVPGGKMEVGETREESVSREVGEETGLAPGEMLYITSINSVMTSGHFYIHHIFLVRGCKGELNENKETDAIMFWAPLSKAKDLCKDPLSHQILDIIEAKLKAG